MPSEVSIAGADRGREPTVEELKRELAEAREQQTATAGILAAISKAPTDAYRVFAEIAASAARLCDGYNVGIFRRDGDHLRLVAHHGPISAVGPVGDGTLPLTRGLPPARAVLERQTLQVADLQIETAEYPEGSDFARRLGFRAALAVPLMRGDEAIGVVTIRRIDARPFTDQQVDLLKTFADQAVIAVENTRLFEAEQASKRELQESLEYQTATGEVLSVISRSPTELQPVLRSIATTAARLCDSIDAQVYRLIDGKLKMVSQHGSLPRLEARYQLPLTRGSVTGRAILERRTVHVDDIASLVETEYPDAKPSQLVVGHRTTLATPMLRESEPVGAILLRRNEVRPFTSKQIALLQTFADQAVIAIENTRLFEEVQARTNELSEALERQTATSEVLSVVSSSPGELKPVFEAMLESAVRICGAKFGNLWLREGRSFSLAATHGAPSAYRDYFRGEPLVDPHPQSGLGLILSSKQPIHIEDVAAPGFKDKMRVATIELAKARSLVAIPMLRENEVIGCIAIYRQEVRPFTEKQVELLTSFASQAVIAIENARLLHELRESLQQQTATADVLKVISCSPTDIQPVFDAIVDSSLRLCGADYGSVVTLEDDVMHLGAHGGHTSEWLDAAVRVFPKRLSDSLIGGRAMLDREIVHVADMQTDERFTASQELARTMGYRTSLGVPMLRGNVPVGAIVVFRQEARLFTDAEIGLLRTFADQAVIAIENTRLFEAEQASKRELQESLEYQTASSEVLGVISRSPTELHPVLDTIVKTAAHICKAQLADIAIVEDTHIRIRASFGEIGSGPMGQVVTLDRATVMGRAVLDALPVQIVDIQTAGDDFRTGRELAVKYGHRTILGVPLMREGRAVGALLLRRNRVSPFSQQQIALLQNFADQAVIAIENTRLFEAEQASKRELQESLEHQTATSDVLQVISGSLGQLQPVYETILARALRHCDAQFGGLYRYQDNAFHAVALLGMPPVYAEYLQKGPIPAHPGNAFGRVLTKQTVHIHDVRAEQAYMEQEPLRVATVELGKARTFLCVPLLKDENIVGAFGVFRQEVRPFSEKQIALVTTFADQAVIAIENTRLFEELQSRTRELARSVELLESLSNVSQAVNSSLELDKVLPTILEHACAMSYAGGGTVYVFDKVTGEFRLAAAHNMTEDHIAMVRAQPMRLNSVVVGECAARQEAVQVSDLRSATPSPLLEVLLRTGVRAVLAVPLLHQSEVVGVLVVRRNQPGIFSPEVIRLVEAFAAQSAIAVENARLFGEIAQKSRELEIASQHKSQFVANMSHELRTPLAAILGYAELLQEGFYGNQSEKSLDALTRIRSNGKHLLGLINTVLDIAKIESGQFTLNMAEYAIESVVETVRSATESLAHNKKLSLKTEVGKPLPVGLGDEQRLIQVLLNLVGNAIKFTDTGEVRVTAKSVNGHFKVSVTDTGPGIPEGHQTRIFEQFHQVDASNTKAKGGTGLGLAIAKQIVEMHGGRIWVESTLGKGSTFQMEFPTRAEFRGSDP